MSELLQLMSELAAEVARAQSLVTVQQDLARSAFDMAQNVAFHVAWSVSNGLRRGLPPATATATLLPPAPETPVADVVLELQDSEPPDRQLAAYVYKVKARKKPTPLKDALAESTAAFRKKKKAAYLQHPKRRGPASPAPPAPIPQEKTQSILAALQAAAQNTTQNSTIEELD
jgi:hypothetical protein